MEWFSLIHFASNSKHTLSGSNFLVYSLPKLGGYIFILHEADPYSEVHHILNSNDSKTYRTCCLKTERVDYIKVDRQRVV